MVTCSGSERFEWTAPDGCRFPARQWGAASGARGVVVCVHGLGGGPDDFDNFGDRLASEGFACFAAALRGQGLDPEHRRRGAFLEPRALAGDFQAWCGEVASRAPRAPVFVCGESLGALLVANAMAQGLQPPRLGGAIFSAPVVALAQDTPRFVRQFLEIVARLFPHGRLSPKLFTDRCAGLAKTSRDEGWVERQRCGPQYIGAFTFGVLAAIGTLMETMPHAADRIATPSLVMAAGRDIFVRTDQVRGWFEQLAAQDKTFLEFPGAYHVLWNDWDRETVLDAVSDWIGRRLAAVRA